MRKLPRLRRPPRLGCTRRGRAGPRASWPPYRLMEVQVTILVGALVSLSATGPPCPYEVPEGRYRARLPFLTLCAQSGSGRTLSGLPPRPG